MKIAAIILPLLLLTAQLQAQSAVDGFNPFVDSLVRVVVVQPDGKILIGGDFTTVLGAPRNHIARLNANGTLDTTFNSNTDGRVLAIAVQPDGKVLVGGVFNNAGGQIRSGLARLDATTGLPDSFNPNAIGGVESIVVQADGRILAGGNFIHIGGQPRNRIARLDPKTGAADSFNPNADGIVYSIAVQPDGKVIAGGHFTSIGGQTRNYIARLDGVTGLADSFNPNANDIVRVVARQPDGKVLAGGVFNSIGGQNRPGIARLDATTGTAEDAFAPNVAGTCYSIALQADGKILVAGALVSATDTEMRKYLARLDATTGLADSFNPNTNASLYSVAVQADGKILCGGQFTSINGQLRFHLARLETDGRLDQTLDLNIAADKFVIATAVQADGKILIGGGFSTILGETRNNLARLNTDGTLDTTFNPDADNQVSAITVQPDGKIVVAGIFTNIGGEPRNGVARLDATTGLADSFDPNVQPTFPFGGVGAIALQADGKVLIGGFFSSVGEESRNHIARLDASTGEADSFDPNANSGVQSIAVQADGNILVGGDFTSIGGETRNRIARLDPATGAADSFDPNASPSSVFAIAVQADGKILVGGNFFGSIGGETRNYLARLDATTGLADSFNPNPNGPVYAIAIQADGKIIAGGQFTGPNSIGGQTRNRIARLDPATGLADSFDPNADDSISTLALQADGKILAGGHFDAMGGQTRRSFARLSNDTAALQNLAVTQTTITWTRGGSSAQFARATFESSTDNVNYTFLGNGTRAGSNWTLTGLSFPTEQNFYVRARGFHSSGDGSESITESVRNAFLVRSATLGNISSRVRVQTGDNAMIGGFIITGTQQKTVIVRGLGPSLSLPGALADPIIAVHGPAGELLGTNDNWNDAATRQEIIDSGLAPAHELESALYGVINPGAYTVVVRGKNNATGIGLFEVYDLDQTVDSELANVSTRGPVETGDNVLIGGLIVLGQNPLRVIARAIGPSLPVSGALGNPTLELYDGNGGLLAANDDWRTDQEAEILATTIPPSNNLESAIVRNLYPGNYTAIVRGRDGTTGIALVEAYGLN